MTARNSRRVRSQNSGSSIVYTCLGIIGLAILTYYFVNTQNSFELFKYNTWLLFVIGAVSLNLLMGTAGQVSIGTSAFLCVGAFGVVWLETELGVAFPYDVVIAGLFAGAIGLVVGLPAMRLRGLYLALATLAAFFIVIFFANQYQSDQGSEGFFLAPVWSNLTLEETQRRWAWVLFGVVAVVLLLTRRIVSERSGRAWRLVRDHETVASTMGMNVTRRKLVAFTLSSIVIGIEGGLLAHFSGNVSAENFTLLISVQYLAAILIGGLDTLVGSVIGAVVIAWLPFVVPDLVGHFMNADEAAQKGPQISQIVYGALIIVFIVSSPNGIVGLTRKLSRSRPAAWMRGRFDRRGGTSAAELVVQTEDASSPHIDSPTLPRDSVVKP